VSTEYLFEMRGVTKVFPGVKALDDVTFCVKPGSVHALCGENGAGKSTLMKVLAGIYKQEAGDILLEGKKVQITDALDAMEKGIAMIHQELNYYPDMTVEANLYIARENTYFAGIVNRKENLRQVHSILSEYGIELNPNARMRELTIAKQQMVEIVRAIAFNAKIIIMDEPTSSLTDNEIRILFQMIRKLASEGKAIIYISHKLDEITEIADTVTVIRDGKTIGSAPITELTQLDIIRMMVGRELTDIYDKRQLPIGDVKLSVEHLSSGTALQDISFEVHRGEIFGFLGLVGAGRSETAETIFGLREKTGGKISIDGKVLRIHHPADAIRHNMAFITEDRRQYGLSLIHSVRQNCVISSIRRYCHSPLHIVSEKQEQDATARMIQALGIKTPTQETLVNNLSGGNQQKIVVAKWLLNDPDLLIMDEPTRGIDVGAKSEIYSIMSDMAADGKAVIMISSEMPELLGMCDRIMVMCEGRNMGIFDRNEFDQVKLMAAATGTKKEDIRL
jgi:inositol transport system ATP-binding protein